MASGPELVGRLGLDKSNYTRGLNEAERDFQRFTANQTRETKRFGGAFGETFHSAERVLKAFGAVTVFREFVDGFKSVSEWAGKFGDKTNENIKGAIRWGTAFKDAFAGMMASGAKALGLLVRIEEYEVGLAKGELPGTVKKYASIEDAANAAEQRAADFKKANPDLARLRAEYQKGELASLDKQLSLSDRIKFAYQDLVTLTEKRNHLDETAIDFKTKDYQLAIEIQKQSNDILDLEKEQARAAQEKADKDKEIAAEKEREHQREMQRLEELKAKRAEVEGEISEIQSKAAQKKADESKLTIGELANLDVFGAGVSIEAGAQGEKARDILALRNQADAARKQGDVASYRDLIGQAQAEADQLHAPGNLLKSTELPSDQADLSAEFQKANSLLAEINLKLAGKFVSQ